MMPSNMVIENLEDELKRHACTNLFYHHHQVTHSLESISLSIPISHHSWQVLLTTPSVCTQLMNVSLHWSTNSSVSMCGSPQENITYEFYFSSSVPCVFFLLLEWFVRRDLSGHTTDI